LQTNMLSLANALSNHVFSSSGKNPKIKSIAPRTSFMVGWLSPTLREACLRK
jgi:hypothetical protein